MEIPIEAKNADELPKEKALQYNEICELVGSIYLESNHRIKVMQEQFNALVGTMQERYQRVVHENNELKAQLNGNFSKDNDGEN